MRSFKAGTLLSIFVSPVLNTLCLAHKITKQTLLSWNAAGGREGHMFCGAPGAEEVSPRGQSTGAAGRGRACTSVYGAVFFAARSGLERFLKPDQLKLAGNLNLNLHKRIGYRQLHRANPSYG